MILGIVFNGCQPCCYRWTAMWRQDDENRAFAWAGDTGERQHPEVAEEGQPERTPVRIPTAQLRDPAAQQSDNETQ